MIDHSVSENLTSLARGGEPKLCRSSVSYNAVAHASPPHSAALRSQDFLQRGSLKLSEVKFRVLDEADEMLDMGFKDDVEFILGAVPDASKVQTLLFSATLPGWVEKVR